MIDTSFDQLRRALNMPWLISNELKRIITKPYISTRLELCGVEYGSNCRFYGRPIVQRHHQSQIRLGDRVSLRSSTESNPLSPKHPVVLATRDKNATLDIGDGCGLTGVTIVAEEDVKISEDVAVGANVTIADTDFHPINPDRRREDFLDCETSPIRIGNSVFIGMESIVLKGVTIGQGSVVGAGSVVTRDVPERTLVAGNPAEVIREL